MSPVGAAFALAVSGSIQASQNRFQNPHPWPEKEMGIQSVVAKNWETAGVDPILLNWMVTPHFELAREVTIPKGRVMASPDGSQLGPEPHLIHSLGKD